MKITILESMICSLVELQSSSKQGCSLFFANAFAKRKHIQSIPTTLSLTRNTFDFCQKYARRYLEYLHHVNFSKVIAAMIKPTTETVIADLLESPYGMALDARAKYLFRESLFSLVRLAKAEQIMEIKNSVEKLTGVGTTYGAYMLSEDEADIDHMIFDRLQQRFEFHEPK
jgi:hypothetical protein